MSGQKKHPLEIFRSSGQTLGRTMSGREASSEVGAPPAGPERVVPPKPMPVTEFELRLSLTGSLVLLFVWILTMGVGYMIGYGRGQASERVLADRSARALGDRIESGGEPEGATDDGGRTTSSRLYGVLLITYQDLGKDRLVEKLNELKRTLRDRYELGGVKLSMWPRDVSGKTMFSVYAGRYETDDDPELLQLKGRLARINDYPDGSKRPFESARIASLPGDPDTARRAE